MVTTTKGAHLEKLESFPPPQLKRLFQTLQLERVPSTTNREESSCKLSRFPTNDAREAHPVTARGRQAQLQLKRNTKSPDTHREEFQPQLERSPTT